MNTVEKAMFDARADAEKKAQDLEHAGQGTAAKNLRDAARLDAFERGLIEIGAQIEKLQALVMLNP